MSYKIPDRLVNGDAVAVVATARAVNPDLVKKGIQILEEWGLKVITGKALYSRDGLFAGCDSERLQDFQEALDNSKVKAIFCARGGYGSSRILDSIDWELFRVIPKWVCGFSDVTALLCHINSLGFASLHSSMPQLFVGDKTGQDSESIRSALFDSQVLLQAHAAPENQTGIAEGIVIGGNLSLLIHLLGSSSELDTVGKILIVEEVDEYLYHLDRMMVQLKRSSKLQQLAGLAVGHLTKMKEGDLKFGKSVAALIRSHVQNDKIPIGFGFPFGHESPNLAIPLGIVGRLEVTADGSQLSLEY